LRPEDRMIAHTGFMIFARAITKEIQSAKIEPAKEEINEIE
jgi:hypothetical protein